MPVTNEEREALERLPIIDDGYGPLLVREDVLALLGVGDIPVANCVVCQSRLPSRDGRRCVACDVCGRES